MWLCFLFFRASSRYTAMVDYITCIRVMGSNMKEKIIKLSPFLLLSVLLLICIMYYLPDDNPFPYTRLVRYWDVMYSPYLLVVSLLAFAVMIAASRKKRQKLLSCKSQYLLFGLTTAIFVLFNPWLSTNFPQLPFSVLLLSAFFCFGGVLPRKISCFVFPLLFILSLIIYASVIMNISLKSDNLIQIFQTNWTDAKPYFTWLNISLLLLVIFGSVFIWCFGMKILKPYSKTTLLTNGCLCMVVFAVAVQPTKQHIPLEENAIWPLGCLDKLALHTGRALSAIVQGRKMLNSLPKSTENDAKQTIVKDKDSVVCILHVGESLNALHLPFNGYHRNTTPWLSSQSSLISFGDCISSAKMTNEAVLTILTNARRNFFETHDSRYFPTSCGLMDLFQSCGYKCGLFWGSDDLSPGNSSLMGQQVRYFGRLAHKQYPYSGDIMEQIPQIEEFISTYAPHNLFLLVDNAGSHIFYHQRNKKMMPYPVKHEPSTYLSPETNAEHAESYVNAYDSTIHYTDNFIEQVVSKLKGKPYIYIYIGDHGEYLGEKGYWSRAAAPANIFHESNACRVPFFVVYSPEFAAHHPHFGNAIEQLKKNKNVSAAHEHLFHTVLGTMGISTNYYDASLDLSSSLVKPYTGPHPDRGGAELPE